MVAARSSLLLAASIYTATAGAGQGRQRRQRRQLPERPAQMLPLPPVRSRGALGMGTGTGHSGNAAALGKAHVRDVVAWETSWHWVPGVALPMWVSPAPSQHPLVWGSGCPWAALISCSPFLAGAGFHRVGELSVTAL